MAKVKIQGHASGSGVLTVTAPNTSSDRTITLPDATGTLATTADTFDPDGAVTINDTGADVDFRVESVAQDTLLFVDGGQNCISVNSGVSSPELRPLPGAVASSLYVKGSDGDKAAIAITRHSADIPGPALRFLKSRNTTVNSYTAVVNNDDIGSIEFYADDGTNYEHMGAQILGRMNGTPGANDLPAELIFSTTADGANTPTERLAIKADGRGISQFTAKAWVSFMSDSGPSFRDSHNCSSITDHAVGDLSINMSYAMSDSSAWSVVASCGAATDNPSDKNVGACPVDSDTFRLEIYNMSGTHYDMAYISAVVFGD